MQMTFESICRLECLSPFAEATVATSNLTTMAQPSLAVDDWLRAKGSRSQIKLKFYTRPALAMLLDDDPQFRSYALDVEIQPRQYIGPVHLISRDHDNFVSVLVPTLPSGRLAWLNIWGYGVDYCHIVKNYTLADWFRKGIRNEFQPPSEVREEKMRLQEMREVRWLPGTHPTIHPAKRRRTT